MSATTAPDQMGAVVVGVLVVVFGGALWATVRWLGGWFRRAIALSVETAIEQVVIRNLVSVHTEIAELRDAGARADDELKRCLADLGSRVSALETVVKSSNQRKEGT